MAPTPPNTTPPSPVSTPPAGPKSDDQPTQTQAPKGGDPSSGFKVIVPTGR